MSNTNYDDHDSHDLTPEHEPLEGGCCDCHQIDLDKVLETHGTPETGVFNIHLGTVIAGDFAERFRALLKHTDPESYARYREIKYPDGEDSVTPETAKAAMTYIWEQATKLLLPYYLSNAALQQQQP